MFGKAAAVALVVLAAAAVGGASPAESAFPGATAGSSFSAAPRTTAVSRASSS